VLYDSASLRRFAGIAPSSEPMLDAAKMLKFRRLLEQHQLAERLFAEVGRVLHSASVMERLEKLVGLPIWSSAA
jgi:IS5 family transposase